MIVTILVFSSAIIEINGTAGYVIGAVIALNILGYLVYSLIKPERL